MSVHPRRRFVILHGLSADSSSDWYRSVAAHYERLGAEVLIPNFPGSYAPNLNLWASALRAELHARGWQADESLGLIGHSTGVLAALRFIETLPQETRLGPCVFVAGFPSALFHSNIPVLVARSPRLDLIKPKLPKVLAVHSSNDWRVPIASNSDWFATKVGAQIYVVKNAGHFIKRHGWSDWSEELYERADQFLEVSSV